MYYSVSVIREGIGWHFLLSNILAISIFALLFSEL